MSNAVVIGLSILGVAIGLAFGYLIARVTATRRVERNGTTAEDVMATARGEAKEILARADAEGRASWPTLSPASPSAARHLTSGPQTSPTVRRS